MPTQVTDLHVARNVPLPAPALLQAEIPRSDAQAKLVSSSRGAIASILFGSDPRFLVIVGP
ncbi:MAG: 3-deoxy-7-phosphoheptulonate synthase, partial [Verrucomicrobiota bacterium]